MNDATMLRGLATVNFLADDMVAAAEWYTKLLGLKPYFVRPETGTPAYLEFRVGDMEHELGIMDRRYAPMRTSPAPAGVIAYWHVDDINATVDRLLSMGATSLDSPTERESGFVTASMVDPFGNILGLMYNPHYLEMLNRS